MKKIILFLALFLISVGIVSAATQISNCAELNNSVSTNCSRDFELTTNINGGCLTGPLCPEGYTGTFDGKGYYISDISLSIQGIDCALFDTVYGTVKNLGIINSSFICNDRISVLTSLLRGTAENVYSRNNIVACHQIGTNVGSVGGLVGTVDKSYAVINNSYSELNDISGCGANQKVGGLVGELHYGSLYDSYSAKNNVGGSPYMAGLVGRSYRGYMNDSYSDVTNSPAIQVASMSSATFTNRLGIAYTNNSFNITQYDTSQLGFDDPWCESSSNFPLITGLAGQNESCEWCGLDTGLCEQGQGPGGDEEVIPEFSDTGKIVSIIIALVVVGIVAIMLMKKKRPGQQK